MVEDYGRPPVGWASGLICYGKGSRKSGEDDIPASVERWSHFGKSEPIRQLVKWLDANGCEELAKKVKEAQEYIEVLEYKGQGEM